MTAILRVVTRVNSLNTRVTTLEGGGSATPVAQVRNTDTTTNINNSTNWTERDVNGITDFMDDSFKAGSNGVICLFTGRVKVTAHIAYKVTQLRVSVLVSVAVDGAKQPIEGRTGYVRLGNNQNQGSSTAIQYVNVSEGDEVTVLTAQDGHAQATYMDPGACMLLLERH